MGTNEIHLRGIGDIVSSALPPTPTSHCGKHHVRGSRKEVLLPDALRFLVTLTDDAVAIVSPTSLLSCFPDAYLWRCWVHGVPIAQRSD